MSQANRQRAQEQAAKSDAPTARERRDSDSNRFSLSHEFTQRIVRGPREADIPPAEAAE